MTSEHLLGSNENVGKRLRGRNQGERQRVERSFRTVLDRAGISNFRFHDLRHTFASWYMMNGGDLYELAKILGHSNIKMTERYAKLAKAHISRTSNYGSADVAVDGKRDESGLM